MSRFFIDILLFASGAMSAFIYIAIFGMPGKKK